MKHLIFGVDPGTTTAVAAIGLDGKLVALTSERHMGLDGVINYITSLGRPALIASDVNPPPDFVLKLSSSLGAPMYFPKKPLKIEDKIALTREHNLKDAHQRDALAAAINAFAQYENKLRKIDARDIGVEAKVRVLAGEKITPDEREEPEEKPEKKPKVFHDSDMDGLRKKISQLQDEIEIKDRKLAEIERLLEVSESKLKSAYDERSREVSADLSIKTLRTRISELEGELGEYKRLSQAIEKNAVGELKPVGVYPKIFGGLTLLRRKMTKEDFEVISKARYVFTDVESNKTILENLRIPALNPKLLTEIKGTFFAQAKDLVRPQKDGKKISIEELISDYRGRRS